MDEGVLHAVLDGEAASLGDAGATALAHLHECATCQARLEHERTIRSRAASILEAAPPTVAAPPFSEVLGRAGSAASASPRPRRRFAVPLGWAATVTLAVGIGWFGRELTTRADERTSERAVVPVSHRLEPVPSGTRGRADEMDTAASDAAPAVPADPPADRRLERQPPAPAPSEAVTGAASLDEGAPEAERVSQPVRGAQAPQERTEAVPLAARTEAVANETPPPPAPPPPGRDAVALEGFLVDQKGWRQTHREEAIRSAAAGQLLEVGGLEPAGYAVNADTVRLTYVLADGEALILEQGAASEDAVALKANAGAVASAAPPPAEARRREAAEQRAPAATPAREAPSITTVQRIEPGVLRLMHAGRPVVLRGALPADSLLAYARRLIVTPAPDR